MSKTKSKSKTSKSKSKTSKSKSKTSKSKNTKTKWEAVAPYSYKLCHDEVTP